MTPQATVVITTHNRRDDLARAVRSALTQTVPVEVLVVDDGSTDGTSQMLADEFPSVRVLRFDQSQGYIVGRNKAAELAATPILFSIDDDAIFSTPHVVEQALAEFDDDRIAGLAIPYIDVNRSPDPIPNHPPPANPADWYVSYTFTGTAYAIRRELFLKIGGYRVELFHQGEERDLAIRLLDAGHVMRLSRADPIHHFQSPKRDNTRVSIFGRRNDILYVWHNVPWRYLPYELVLTTYSGLRYGIRTGRAWTMLRGLLRGYAAIVRYWQARRPVRVETYRLNRRLMRRGPVTFTEAARSPMD